MDDALLTAALALVKEHLGAKAARELSLKIDDADRIKVIRDAFFEGRDREAVTLMRDLAQWGQQHDGNFRLLPVSSPPPLILPTQTVQVTARPQGYAFSPLALLVSETSRYFDINDILVGNRSQFLQSGNVPADVFTPIPAALDVQIANAAEDDITAIKQIDVRMRADVLSRSIVPIDCDICMTSMDLVLVVTNIGVEPAPWRAMWLGKDVPMPRTRVPARTALAIDADDDADDNDD